MSLGKSPLPSLPTAFVDDHAGAAASTPRLIRHPVFPILLVVPVLLGLKSLAHAIGPGAAPPRVPPRRGESGRGLVRHVRVALRLDRLRGLLTHSVGACGWQEAGNDDEHNVCRAK